MKYFLYSIYDSSGDLLYIGYTKRPKQRFRDHRRAAPFRNCIAAILVDKSFANKRDALDSEAKAIFKKKPPFNNHHYNAGNGRHPKRLALLSKDPFFYFTDTEMQRRFNPNFSVVQIAKFFGATIREIEGRVAVGKLRANLKAAKIRGTYYIENVSGWDVLDFINDNANLGPTRIKPKPTL